MSAVQVTRRDILRLVARHEWDTLRNMVAMMSPEQNGELYYVALVHLQLPEWTDGRLDSPWKTIRTIVRRSRDPYVLSIAYCYLGEIFALGGHVGEAEVQFCKAMDYADDPMLIANARNCLGHLFFNLGLFARSRSHYATANEFGSDQFVTIYSKIGLARCALRFGDSGACRSGLESAAATLDRFGARHSTDQEIVLRIGRAEYLAATDAIESALLQFDDAEFRAVTSSRSRHKLRVLEARSEVLIEAGHPYALESLRRLKVCASEVGIRLYLDRATRLEAELARQQDEPVETIRALCDRIQDPGQRFIAFSRLLSHEDSAAVELQRLGSAMSTEVVREMRAAHLAT